MKWTRGEVTSNRRSLLKLNEKMLKYLEILKAILFLNICIHYRILCIRLILYFLHQETFHSNFRWTFARNIFYIWNYQGWFVQQLVHFVKISWISFFSRNIPFNKFCILPEKRNIKRCIIFTEIFKWIFLFLFLNFSSEFSREPVQYLQIIYVRGR